MNKVVVVDPFSTGHHLTYLCAFTLSFLRLGREVLVLGPEPLRVEAYIQSEAPELLQHLRVMEFVDVRGSYEGVPNGGWRSLYRIVRRWLKITKYILFKSDHGIGSRVFLPWIDSYTHSRLNTVLHRLIFPFDWGCLYFQPVRISLWAEPDSQMEVLLAKERIFRSSRCQMLGVLVEDELENLSHRLGGKPITLFPDFADIRSGSLSDTQFSALAPQLEQSFVIGTFGSMAPRKGFLALLDVVLAMRENTEFFFVFAGELIEEYLSPDERLRLRYVMEKCDGVNAFFHFERIETEIEMNTLIKSVNLLFAVYEQFPFSSNMLTKAAGLNVALLCNEGSYMGRLTEEFGLGSTVPSGDRVSIESEFLRLRETSSGPLSASWRGADFMRRNDVEKLTNLLGHFV